VELAKCAASLVPTSLRCAGLCGFDCSKFVGVWPVCLLCPCHVLICSVWCLTSGFCDLVDSFGVPVPVENRAAPLTLARLPWTSSFVSAAVTLVPLSASVQAQQNNLYKLLVCIGPAS